MTRPLSKLERRIVDISYKKGLAHLSSCLTAVRLIDQIYQVKKDDEPFVLDNAHCSLAYYVILEKFWFFDAEKLFDKHGVHCNRDIADRIDCSGGSLGHGIGIAVGMALADRRKNAYVMTSDGALAEGANWEALRIAGEQRLENLRVFVNANGTGAYGTIDADLLEARIRYFYPSIVIKTNLYDFPEWMQGLNGHYITLDEEKYKQLTIYG